jgi:hypothetical protein
LCGAARISAALRSRARLPLFAVTRCIFVSAPATEPPAFPIKIPFIYGKHSSAPLIEMESELFSPVFAHHSAGVFVAQSECRRVCAFPTFFFELYNGIYRNSQLDGEMIKIYVFCQFLE